MLAKAIGYQPQVIAGRVPGGVDGAPDGFTRHSLVKINGLYYDPEAQFDGWARGVYGLGYYPMYLQILSIAWSMCSKRFLSLLRSLIN